MKPPTAPFGPLFARLQAWPWLGTLLTLIRRFREDRLALTASSLTFTSVISLIPMATVMLALFSAFPMFSTLQDTLQHYFVSTLVPDTIARPVLGAITQFSTRASRLGLHHAFVLRANGVVVAANNVNGVFTGAKFRRIHLYPGDQIVVPYKLPTGAFLRGPRDWTQITSQLALTGATVAVIRP